MKIIKKLLLSLLALLLSVIVLMWSANTLFGSATTLNTVARNSGAYEIIARQWRTLLGDTSKVPDSYQKALQTAVESSLTGEQVEAMFQPLLVDVISWLNQPESVPPPPLVLVIQPAKVALLAKLKDSGLAAAELAVAQAQLTQQIPDQLELTKVTEVTGTPTNSSFEGTPEAGQEKSKNEGMGSPLGSDPIPTLKALKSGYRTTQTATLWATLAIVLLTILLIWLSRHDGRAMLRRPAWQFLIAGGFTIIGWAILTLFFKPAAMTDDIQTMGPQVAIGVLREVYSIALVYGLIVFVIGLVLYGLSFLIRPTLTGSSRMVQPAPLKGVRR